MAHYGDNGTEYEGDWSRVWAGGQVAERPWLGSVCRMGVRAQPGRRLAWIGGVHGRPASTQQQWHAMIRMPGWVCRACRGDAVS
ncbi:hypothetical protein BM1_07557 [Bipolaris maydis]|nr:hypothetical protein BM1_07557 [Bipolaris maydis]